MPCPTCHDAAYLADDALCPVCVCDDCHQWARAAQQYTAEDPSGGADDPYDPQECTRPACGWARAMGTART